MRSIPSQPNCGCAIRLIQAWLATVVSQWPRRRRRGPRERKPGVKLREKGKKESQVFTSVADNPRLCVNVLTRLRCMRCRRQVVRIAILGSVFARWLDQLELTDPGPSRQLVPPANCRKHPSSLFAIRQTLDARRSRIPCVVGLATNPMGTTVHAVASSMIAGPTTAVVSPARWCTGRRARPTGTRRHSR